MSEEWLEDSFDAPSEFERIQRENQNLKSQLRSLNEFSQRIDQNLSDPHLYQIMLDEFLIHSKADRAVILVKHPSQETEIVVNAQSCERSVKVVPVPYFLEDFASSYVDFIQSCFESREVQSSQWLEPVMVHPDIFMSRVLAKSFEVDGEEGEWLVCLEWIEPVPKWEIEVQELFENMIQYAQAIVDQRQMRFQIEELQDQDQGFLACMPQALIGLDLLGHITQWTGQAELFLGLRLDEALGVQFVEIFPEFQEIIDLIPDCMSSEKPIRLSGFQFNQQLWEVRVFSLMAMGRGEVGLMLEPSVDLPNQG